MEILKLENVDKQFGGLKANDQVSFRVEQGEILGLIGPNGAGKTTLVNLISGTDRPSAGEIYFKGARITNLGPERRAAMGIARTYQIVRVFKGLSVLENVMVGALYGNHKGRFLNRKEAEEYAREMIEFVGLQTHIHRSAGELNLAFMKKLQLARALAMRPQFILLDEVMGGLNPKEVEDAIQLVMKVKEHGVTILIIEHLMKVIMALSNRIVVLHQGRVIATGTPKEVAEHPEVIAAYFGERYSQKLKGGQPSA